MTLLERLTDFGLKKSKVKVKVIKKTENTFSAISHKPVDPESSARYQIEAFLEADLLTYI